MRRLATELGVVTASLYRRFPDRDALLAEMSELVLAESPRPPDAGDWRSKLVAEARSEWQLYQRHPWMLPLLAQSHPPIGPALLGILERFLATLDKYAMSKEEMLLIYLSVSGLVQGLALLTHSEGARTDRNSSTAEAFRAATITLTSPETHPTLTRYFDTDAVTIDLDLDRDRKSVV